MERDQALEMALGQIEKQYGKGAIMRLGEHGNVGVAAIPTGALALDIALGIGGLPRGRVVEVYGPESSGKSTLAMHVVAEAQRNGGVCAYIDAEHAMDPVYASAIGVNVDELLISQPDTGEQALEITDMLIRSGALDVVVIDSVAALVPRAEIEGEMGDTHVGLQARLMSQALRKLTANLNRSNTICLFINQLREKIGVMFGSPETTPGGRALKFYSSVRLDIRRIESIKDGAEITGNRTRVKVVKNKVAPPFKQAEFDIMYGKGISREGSLLDVGVELGIVKKSGAWFTYEGEQLGQGRENAKTFLSENLDMMLEISEKIRQEVGIDDGRGRRRHRRHRGRAGRHRELSAGTSSGRVGAGPHGPAPTLIGRDRAPAGRPRARRFYVRTYGCQMNEHDSERIAGLLAAEGMEATDDLESADVVVLNTCCIRENADNKLYGHLGRLKALKAERPDLQIAVGGCLAQKDRELIVERAGHVDVVFGTHNLAHAASLLERARFEGPVVEILEEHEAYPSALPARRDQRHSAWVTIQVGCDNSCTFCIVPIVRGPEISRRMGDIVHEVEELAADGVREITVLGQNVNSYGRDLGAGPVPPAVRRPAARARRGRRHRAHPVHVAAPEGPPPRDHRGHGRVRRRCASTCTCRCSRAATARWRACTAATPPSATSAASPTPAPPSPTSRSPPTSSSASPARPTTTSSARSRWSTPPRTTPPTRSCSRPGPARPRPTWSTTSSRPRSRRSACSRLIEVVERHALAKHEARVGRTESLLVEGPSKNDAAMWSGRTRQNKLVHFSPGGCDEPDGRRRGRRPRHLRRAALAARRPRRAWRPPAVGPASASPSPLRLRDRHRTSRSSAPPHPGSRRSRSRWHGRSATSRSCRSTRCRCTAASTSAPPSPPPAERAAVPHHLVDVADPTTSGRSRGSSTRRAPRSPTSSARAAARCSSAAPGSTCRRSIDPLTVPARGPDGARRDRSPAPRRPRASPPPTPSCSALDPDAAARIEPGNARRIARALEVIEITGRPFSSFGAGLQDVRGHRCSRSASPVCGSRGPS